MADTFSKARGRDEGGELMRRVSLAGMAFDFSGSNKPIPLFDECVAFAVLVRPVAMFCPTYPSPAMPALS